MRYKTQIHRPALDEGKSIEETIAQAIATNTPITTDTHDMIYTADKDGVLPQYDVRTDRFDLAYEAANKFAKSAMARSIDDPSKLLEDGGTDSE